MPGTFLRSFSFIPLVVSEELILVYIFIFFYFSFSVAMATNQIEAFAQNYIGNNFKEQFCKRYVKISANR